MKFAFSTAVCPDWDFVTIAVRAGERAHHGTDVRVQVIPDQDDRGVELVVRGGDQGGHTPLRPVAQCLRVLPLPVDARSQDRGQPRRTKPAAPTALASSLALAS